MNKLMMLALTASAVGCGVSGSAGELESYVAGVNPDSHAREVMVDCVDDLWTVHVRAPANVRGVEIEVIGESVSYAPVDYPMIEDDELQGYGFVATMPVVNSERALGRYRHKGAGATTVACDAGVLPVRLVLLDDRFEHIECVTVGWTERGCLDYGPSLTHSGPR